MSSSHAPVPQGMSSFWRSHPGSLDDHRTTDTLPETADILIIGAGYSGGALLTHFLAEEDARNKKFVVLEARQLCSGATGRNGGHLKPDYYNLCGRLSEQHGVEAAAEIANFERANVDAVREFIRESGADCDFVMTNAMDVQLTPQHDKTLKRRYDKLLAAGVEATKGVFHHDGPEQAELYSGVKGAKGLFTYATGHLWPYKLIHHMFSRAIGHDNVSLQTHTRATSISPDPEATSDGWIVSTPRGSIRARQVIVATNAYTASVLPEYKDKIIPYRTVCSRIVTPRSKETPSPPPLSCTYSLRFNAWDFDYLIPRPDGSIVVGGARHAYIRELGEWYDNVNDSTVTPGARRYFDNYMQRTFRGWENSGAYTDQIWTGIMGYSSDMLPRIGHVPGRKNVFIMGGFTGHGMPQIFLAAKGLSEMILKGSSYAETGIPRLFEETKERLASKENLVMDLYETVSKL